MLQRSDCLQLLDPLGIKKDYMRVAEKAGGIVQVMNSLEGGHAYFKGVSG